MIVWSRQNLDGINDSFEAVERVLKDIETTNAVSPCPFEAFVVVQ